MKYRNIYHKAMNLVIHKNHAFDVATHPSGLNSILRLPYIKEQLSRKNLDKTTVIHACHEIWDTHGF